MAYQLSTDPSFINRVRSCMWQQAQTLQSDEDEETAAMANDLLKGNATTIQAMVNMIAAFPGLVDGATITMGNGNQLVDQSAITDGTILAQVQADWKTIADLFFTPPPVVPLSPPVSP